MSQAEWESVCDGCGKCCLVKLEDEENGQVYYTDVACEQLDLDTCRCRNYSQRKQLVPTCICLTVDDLDDFHWLPRTCSYRLLHEGKGLPGWHPLITGNAESVHMAGISVRDKVVPESAVTAQELEERVILWLE